MKKYLTMLIFMMGLFSLLAGDKYDNTVATLCGIGILILWHDIMWERGEK